VIDSGVDLERFRTQPARLQTGTGPAFLCIGGLTERKNVVRLADAFAFVGEGTLTFAGDGPLRPQLEGREAVALLGTVEPERIPELISASDVVCQPSLVEPFGQALLEGMACGRSVVATAIGGPPEFVPPEAGALVDPLDEDAIAEALRAAAELPSPNPAARAAAEGHDVNEQARRVEAILLGALQAPRAEARRAA
jgi:glycosyltransferase involved in cell wall biosynthesis